MNKTEQKAFDRLIKDAAHKSVLHLSDVSFDLTQSVFLELSTTHKLKTCGLAKAQVD